MRSIQTHPLRQSPQVASILRLEGTFAALLRRLAARARPFHLWLYLVAVVVVFGIFWISSYQRMDPDFGWHLVTGNYIRVHGIPAHDLYSYTAPTFPWIDHEWGMDVLVSWLYQGGGYLLTAAVFAAMWTAAIVLQSKRKQSWVVLLATLAILPYSGIRGTTFTVLFLSVLLRLGMSTWRWRFLAVPFLLLLWANVHAGFIVGLAVVAYWGIFRNRRWWLVLAGSFLATLANPYGIRLYEEVFRTLLDSKLHSQITEWLPFYIPMASLVFMVMWGIGFAFFDLKRLRRWAGLAPLFLAASLSANRNVPLFVIAAIQPAGRYWHQVRHMLPRPLNLARRLAVGAFIIMAAGAAGWQFYQTAPWANSKQGYPAAAATYLSEHPCPGHIFNFYDWGGYLIWKLPGQPLYIDGRMPTWQDSAGELYMDHYYKILADPSYRAQQFARYNVQCVVASRGSKTGAMLQYLSAHGWRTANEYQGQVVLIKTTAPRPTDT